MKPTSKQWKLKDACAVLGISAKELQNLVQLRVVEPERRGKLCVFDGRRLMQARVALYLRETLGMSSEVMARFVRALPDGLRGGARTGVRFRSSAAGEVRALEVSIPVGALALEVEMGIRRVEQESNGPRGRARAGWRAEMMRALGDAGRELGAVSTEQARQAARSERKRRALPEVTLVGPETRKTA